MKNQEIIEEVKIEITKNRFNCTLVCPGPSSVYCSPRLFFGFVLSVNNAIPDAIQFFKDKVVPRSRRAVYIERSGLEEVFKNRGGYEYATVQRKKTGSKDMIAFPPLPPEDGEGSIAHPLSTTSSALAFLIMCGARRIRVIGNDFIDWDQGNYRRGVLPGTRTADGRPVSRNHKVSKKYFDKSPIKKERFESAVLRAVKNHGTTVINLSPFTDIEGTIREYEDRH